MAPPAVSHKKKETTKRVSNAWKTNEERRAFTDIIEDIKHAM